MGKFPSLNTLAGKIATELAGEMYAIGDAVASEAHVSITTGSVSGAEHVPSKPGEPPHNDTGGLASGIEVHIVSPLRVQVVSNARQSIPLEFGTSKMEPRPFLLPARDAKRKEAQKRAAQAVNRAIRKFARG